MSIADEITRLQGAKADLKTAIEGKGVIVPSATRLDGYAALVDEISAGGWVRPSEWPDLDSLDLTDFDGVYLTYDLTAVDWEKWLSVTLYLNSSGSVLERGHIANGAFVVDEQITFTGSQPTLQTDLVAANGNVQLWRVRPEAGNRITAFNLNKRTGSSLNANHQPLVEMRGRLPYATSTNPGNRGAVSLCVQSVQLEMGSDWNASYMLTGARNLQQLKLTGSGRMTSISYLFNDCRIPDDFDMSSLDLSAVSDCRAPFLGSAIDKVDIQGTGFGETELASTKSFFFYGGPLCCGEINLAGVDFGANMFSSNSVAYIEEFTPAKIYAANININSWTSLSRASLLRIIEALPETQEAVTLNMGAVNQAKLTAEEIAVATGKGWTVS